MQNDSFIIYLLLQAISIYELLIVIRAIISWFNISPYNPLYRFLITITEPFLMRIRKWLPLRSGMDFSPLIAILLLSLLRRIIAGI